MPASGATVVPDLRWLVGGGFVMIFLLVGWVRAPCWGEQPQCQLAS